MRFDDGGAVEQALRGTRLLAWIGVFMSLPAVLSIVRTTVMIGSLALHTWWYVIVVVGEFALLGVSAWVLASCRPRGRGSTTALLRKYRLASRVIAWTAGVGVMAPMLVQLLISILLFM